MNDLVELGEPVEGLVRLEPFAEGVGIGRLDVAVLSEVFVQLLLQRPEFVLDPFLRRRGQGRGDIELVTPEQFILLRHVGARLA